MKVSFHVFPDGPNKQCVITTRGRKADYSDIPLLKKSIWLSMQIKALWIVMRLLRKWYDMPFRELIERIFLLTWQADFPSLHEVNYVVLLRSTGRQRCTIMRRKELPKKLPRGTKVFPLWLQEKECNRLLNILLLLEDNRKRLLLLFQTVILEGYLGKLRYQERLRKKRKRNSKAPHRVRKRLLKAG